MTEAQWHTCAWPHRMVEFLWETGSKRKLRLLAVACCRRIAHLVTDAHYQAALAAVEGYVEGTVSRDRVEAVQAACSMVPWLGSSLPELHAAQVLTHLPFLCLGDDPAANLLDFFSFIHMAADGVRSR